MNYLVGNTATAPSGSTNVSNLMSVPWSSLLPGDSVIVYPGTYTGVTTIHGAVGTSTTPIIVTALSATLLPILTDSLDIQASSYLQVSFLKVQGPTYSGVIIRQASDHINVTDCLINKAPVGMTISSDAGVGHKLLRNTICGSLTHGISADGANGTSAIRTLICSNTIYESGQHGMEIRGSYYQIEYNEVAYGGTASGGTSGIHIYASTNGDGTGQNNWVRYNNCWGQHDAVASDGNGIEVDQYCNDNLVSYNVCWSNDGAGIIVFDASGNNVHNNTAYGNGLDPGSTHGSLGQIILNGTLAANVGGNNVYNNLCVSTLPTVPALYVDTRAVAGGNFVGPNQCHPASGGVALRWTDSATYSTATGIDSVCSTPGSNVDAPNFTNILQLFSHGLKPTSKASTLGVIPTGELDILAQPAAAGQSFMGAYFVQ